jgi:hypothetical protein
MSKYTHKTAPTQFVDADSELGQVCFKEKFNE